METAKYSNSLQKINKKTPKTKNKHYQQRYNIKIFSIKIKN